MKWHIQVVAWESIALGSTIIALYMTYSVLNFQADTFPLQKLANCRIQLFHFCAGTQHQQLYMQ